MSVGHLVHVLLTVYNAMEHGTQKSPGPMCGWVRRILRPDSCMSGSSWSKVPLWSIWFVAVPPWRSLLQLSQSMTWFSSTAWSVMADLWVILLSLALEARFCVPAVKESTSFRCSFILRPSFLPVSQCKNLGSSCKGSVDQLGFLIISDLVHWMNQRSSVMYGEDG